MQEVVEVAKALGDETRLRLLCALGERELCVCQLFVLVELAPSTVSKHLAILRAARLVEMRKEGRWVYYRLAGREAPEPARSALAWLRGRLGDDPILARDRRRLARILKMTPEELCERGCRC
ncbi:winged helix-turn-helix transcriptional regulator [bacterium]|nr:winged helix-turn-helix transcriptional regulator [bacterium]